MLNGILYVKIYDLTKRIKHTIIYVGGLNEAK